MAALPDISVLLPLTYEAHAHHAAAVAWLETVQDEGEVVLCRVSQMGLLRLLNNPVAMGVDVQNGSEAWAVWDELLADERFRFMKEPAKLASELRAFTTTFTYQPKRWQDAYLAAFALAIDTELVTFDSGFRSFPGLRCRILTP